MNPQKSPLNKTTTNYVERYSATIRVTIPSGRIIVVGVLFRERNTVCQDGSKQVTTAINICLSPSLSIRRILRKPRTLSDARNVRQSERLFTSRYSGT